MVKSWRYLLRNSEFLLIWTSQILSQITINVLNFVLLFTLFEKTQSSVATSFLWITYSLPAIILGPFASASVDMLDLRKVLMATNFFQAVVIAFYAIIAYSSPFLAYAVVLGYSALNQFYVPAEYATIPRVVKKEFLPQANGLFLITQQGSLILGFGVAGIILKALGISNTLILCSFFLFVAFSTVYFLPQMKTREELPKKLDEVFIKFFESIVVGYKFIKENKLVLAPFLLMVSMQVALTVTIVNAPAFALEIIKIPLSVTGIYLVVPGGIGALLASFFIPRLLARGVRKIKIIKVSLVTLALSLIFITFFFSELELFLRVIFSFTTLIAMGFSYVGILIPSQTFLQENTPSDLRARVFGNLWFLVVILTVFPVILSGTISEIFGSKTLMLTLTVAIFSLFMFLKERERKYLLPEKAN
ncbi:hypothetical protein A2714_00155 [Candidatus Woesebacteria bacterium RIFCSPHIGHO2_01_FULL_38_9]|uniref:Major facilitator superfamily (MFS) profile domain-containing protein n=2 Tax=Candidatus Woeseibacteriota TaxID=1752722 RepID=A0A1F7Y2L7_9BACT|nr:MAG: hypothetical protein A2714_00155 [Candidatus Woesebacteria bacterium RIFCSPHIGHO2_01_FULL_38_9]OGM58263.1 MAG: hypothetical protein A3A75_04460 [Candidatus Woesebacteria bacterium RIFCSPLOWO2_01_FULL_39_10]